MVLETITMNNQSILHNLDYAEDVLLNVNTHFRIKLRVNLSSKNQNNERLNGDYSKTYNSKRFSNIGTNTGLHLNTSKYMIFSYFNNIDGVINNQDIYLTDLLIPVVQTNLVGFIKNVRNNYDAIYIQENNMIDIDHKLAEQATVVIDNLTNDGVLLFEPCIHVNQDNTAEPGVRVYFNTEQDYTTIPFEVLVMITSGTLRNFDIHTAGLNLINIAMMSQMYTDMTNGGANINSNQVSNQVSTPSKTKIKRTIGNRNIANSSGNLNSRGNLNTTSKPPRSIKTATQSLNNNIQNKNNIKDVNNMSPDETMQSVEDMFNANSNVPDSSIEIPFEMDEPKSNETTVVPNILNSAMDSIKENAKEIHKQVVNERDQIISEGESPITESDIDDLN